MASAPDAAAVAAARAARARGAALGAGSLATAEAHWALARVHALQQARGAALQSIDGGGEEDGFAAALVRGVGGHFSS